VDLTKVNKRVLESLIRCGALDSTGVYRSRLMAVLEEALDYGQRIQREKNSAQMSLFDTGSGEDLAINLPAIPNIDEWDDREKLQQEKETLGFYVTGHPLDRYKPILEKFTNVDALSIREAADKSAVRIGGTIAGCQGDPHPQRRTDGVCHHRRPATAASRWWFSRPYMRAVPIC
jgi:DNA polymerase-3 subunit alpha